MASSASSEFILFIGAVIAASALAGSAVAISADLAGAYSDRLDARADALDTSFAIINDPRDVQVNPLEIHILNTGDAWIEADQLLVFVDGTFAENVTASSPSLAPGTWGTLTISEPATGVGDHVIDIVASTGAKERFTFYQGSP